MYVYIYIYIYIHLAVESSAMIAWIRSGLNISQSAVPPTPSPRPLPQPSKSNVSEWLGWPPRLFRPGHLSVHFEPRSGLYQGPEHDTITQEYPEYTRVHQSTLEYTRIY